MTYYGLKGSFSYGFNIYVYSQTCIKRSPLEQRKGGLLRQVLIIIVCIDFQPVKSCCRGLVNIF